MGEEEEREGWGGRMDTTISEMWLRTWLRELHDTIIFKYWPYIQCECYV